MFNKAYEHMSGCIDKIYKDLTKAKNMPTGGVAFLSLEDAEVSDPSSAHMSAPDADGRDAGTVSQRCTLQRHASEQAVRGDGATLRRRKDDGGAGAALRHSQVSRAEPRLIPWSHDVFVAGVEVEVDAYYPNSFHPAPFFVLDEVDAALDPTNVSKLARYVRHQAEKSVQFLIISLKSTL